MYIYIELPKIKGGSWDICVLNFDPGIQINFENIYDRPVLL